MTKLVGAISDSARIIALAEDTTQPRIVDWVEARLDLIRREEWPRVADAARLLESSGTPVLATIRLASEGGAWRTDDDERVDGFAFACEWASWIDVETSSQHAGHIIEHAHGAGRKVVVSYHDFEATPPLAELEEIYARARALEADIVKISTMVTRAEDHDSLTRLLANHRDGSLCVIGMGASAVSLRMYLPTVGSALAYSYLDTPGAPGQLSARELSDALRLTIPGYR